MWDSPSLRTRAHRAPTMYSPSMTEIVRIELGASIFEAERIVQEAVTAGLTVELLRNEHPETGGAFALGSCALLVAGTDEADLRQLLAEYGY